VKFVYFQPYMTTFLKFTFLSISILIAFNVNAEKVECPPTMKWRFEGFCGKELKSIKDDKCPQGSKLTQLHVTGTMMCVSEGKCSGDMIPNAVGICVDSPKKKSTPPPTSSSH
jgi:hypothetical protein